jgi:hypothetical protein
VAPAPPAAPPAPPPAAAAASPPGDFAARFVEAASRGSRSLRADLQRYRVVRIEGDELVLQPGEGALLFDPKDPALRQKLLEAAREVTGRALGLRLLPAAGAAAPARTPPPRAAGAGDVEQRILGDWPGSERVDF